MLDALEAKRTPSLRQFVEILVLPIVEKTREGLEGEAHVRINTTMIGHPSRPLIREEASRRRTTNAHLMTLVARAVPTLPEALLAPRMVLVTGLVLHGLVD